jgi:hypothetical protein
MPPALSSTIGESGRAGPFGRLSDRHLLTRRFRRIERVAWFLILLGIAWRLLGYLLAFPLWGDESMVAVNLIVRDFSTVTRRHLADPPSPLPAIDPTGPSEGG